MDRRYRITATQLRADFDGTFARAHVVASPPELDLLVIHVADHHYAMLLHEVTALHADRKLTEAPSHQRELLGLVGLRGVVAPVYDLRILLGYPAASAPRWLAQVNVAAPCVLAFEHFERHLRVKAQDLAELRAETSATPNFVRGAVSTADGTLSVLDLASIFESLTQDRRAHGSPERREERR
jgi:chemotaxis signal transduction protein